MDVQTWNFTVKREPDDEQSSDCLLQTQIKQEQGVEEYTSSDESDSTSQVCEENVVFIKQEEKQLEFVPPISTTCQNDLPISGNVSSTSMSDESIADPIKQDPLTENSGSNNTVQIHTYPFMVTRFDQQNSELSSVDSNFDEDPVRSHYRPKSYRKSDSFTSVTTSRTVTLNCEPKTVSTNSIPLSSPKSCKSRLTPNLLTTGVFPFAKHKVVSCQTTNFTSREFPKDSKWGPTVHQAANEISIKPASSSESQMFIRIEPLSKDDVQRNDNAIISQSVPTFNRQNVPTATQLSVPVAKRWNVSTATQLSVPVANRQNVPTIQLSVPVSNRQNVPTATQLSVPVSKRQNVPTAAHLSVPVSNRHNVPTTLLSVPVANGTNVSTETQLNVLVAKRRFLPKTITLNVPKRERQKLSKLVFLRQTSNEQNVPTTFGQNVLTAVGQNVPVSIGQNVPTAIEQNVPMSNIDLTFNLISRRLSEDRTTLGGGRKRKHPSEADFTQISVNQKHEKKSCKLTKERQLSIEVVDNIICFESLSEDESNNCGSTSEPNAEPINDLLQDLDQNGQNDLKPDSK